jgi:vacuolar iron transporter family protein
MNSTHPLAPGHARDVQHHYHTHEDPHRVGSPLSDIILGGQDGLVNVLGVILGVAAASGETRIVLAAGLAATFAESVSMAAVAYTSRRTDRDYYASEQAREYRHIQQIPELEREEIAEIYRAKGFEGELLERIVSKVTSDPDVWVAVMMTEEHRLACPERTHPLRSAFIVGLSALVGSLIPLLPFVFTGIARGVIISLVLSALALFVFGAYKARVTVGRPMRSGVELAIIGLASALIGYAVGALFA